MFPCAALSPTLYPGFLRVPATLSASLSESAAQGRGTGFLVEDHISQHVGYIHRTFSSISSGDILPFSAGSMSFPRTTEPSTETSGQLSRSSPGSVYAASPDYLKFGVGTILAPSTWSREFLHPLSINLTYIFTHSQSDLYWLVGDLKSAVSEWIKILIIIIVLWFFFVSTNN